MQTPILVFPAWLVGTEWVGLSAAGGLYSWTEVRAVHRLNEVVRRGEADSGMSVRVD